MSDAFDPYYKWLGIPPEEQPPDHYRLLAIRQFETDEDVIANAADQRMTHIRTFQSGQHSEHSQRLLNEISKARTCLLDTKKKAAYDESLRSKSAPAAVPSARTVRAPAAVSAPPVVASRRRKNTQNRTTLFAVIGVAVVLIVGAIGLLVSMNGDDGDDVARVGNGTDGNDPSNPIDPPQDPTEPDEPRVPPPVEPPSDPPSDPVTEPDQPTTLPPTPTPPTPTPTPSDPPEPSDPPPPDPPTPSEPNPRVAPSEEWATLPVSVTNSIGMKFTLIPDGEFLMGSPDSQEEADADERPQHRVRITKPFYFAVFETTQAQYENVLNETPSYQKVSAHPVTRVSWDDAVRFCERLGDSEGEIKYRLPTEAEWEYACRAGTTTPWFFGEQSDDIGRYAWHGGRGATPGPKPVGSYEPNPWGLFDVYGNVGEWCSDWYDKDYYAASPDEDPQGLRQSELGNTKLVRGGNWGRAATACRSAYRGTNTKEVKSDKTGFRVVLNVESVLAARSAADSPLTLSAEIAASPTEIERFPLPDEALRDAEEKSVEALYAADVEAADIPSKKVELVKKWLQAALAPDLTPERRYGLLEQARKLAITAADADTAVAVVERMDRTFEIDVRELKLETILALTETAKFITQNKLLAKQSLRAVDESFSYGDVEGARQLLAVAVAAAKKSRDGVTMKAASEAKKDLQRFAEETAKAEQAAAALMTNPEDPQANLVVGRYHCLFMGDWQTGLPLLMHAGDEQLKSLAERDFEADEADAQGQVTVGDEWWKLAEEAEGLERKNAERRAAHWYRTALPDLKGVTRSRVEERLEEAAPPQAAVTTQRRSKSPGHVPRTALLRKKFAPEAIKIGDHYYAVFKTNITWTQAVAACAKMGGYLACLETPEEQAAVAPLKQNSVVWVGAAGKSGRFFWLNGVPLPVERVRIDDSRYTYVAYAVTSGLNVRPNSGSAPFAIRNIQGFICEWDH